MTITFQMNFYDWTAEEFASFCNKLIITVDDRPHQAAFPYCWQVHSQKEREDCESSEKHDPIASRMEILECLSQHQKLTMGELVKRIGGNQQSILQHCRTLHSHKCVRLREDESGSMIEIIGDWRKKIKSVERKVRTSRRIA